jgi:hypothetical protein
MHIAIVFPPLVVIRASVAAVWLYEGLWCKILGRMPSQVEVVTAVPRLGPRFGSFFLKALGIVEVTIAVWAGRPDGTPMPGRSGRVTAAPVLFKIADLLGPAAPVASDPPPGVRRVATRDLPPALQPDTHHYTDANSSSPRR